MKPTLQEIADMNHSEGVLAMREHYDPSWPMVTAEPVEGETLKEYEMDVTYSYITYDTVSVKVVAASEEEALELAETAAESKIEEADWTVSDIDITREREIDG